MDPWLQALSFRLAERPNRDESIILIRVDLDRLDTVDLVIFIEVEYREDQVVLRGATVEFPNDLVGLNGNAPGE